MIYRLNADMIDSPKGEYDMFVFDERCSYSSALIERKGVPYQLMVYISGGDFSTRSQATLVEMTG